MVGTSKILLEVPASTEWEYWSLDCRGHVIQCGHAQFGLQKDKQCRYIHSYYENDSCQFCNPPYVCLEFQYMTLHWMTSECMMLLSLAMDYLKTEARILDFGDVRVQATELDHGDDPRDDPRGW